MNIPGRVKECRLHLKESQGEFGERFDVSHAAVSEWEAGKSNVPNRVIEFVLDQNWPNYLPGGETNLPNREFKQAVVIKGDYNMLANSYFRGPVIVITDKPGEVHMDASIIYGQGPVRYMPIAELRERIEGLFTQLEQGKR